jgi:hypothetical protein
MAHVAPAKRGELADSNIVLLLSLKLILLAFFILLNAISDYEEARTKSVISSVNRAFSGQLEPINAPALLDGSPGLLPEAETLINDVGSLFESIIPAIRSTRTDRARIVHIDLPSGALFKIGADRLRPDRTEMIRRFAKTLLRYNAREIVYKLEFLHGVPADGAAGALREQEVRRASGVVSLLAGAGLPADLLSIGVLPGRSGRVSFVLTLRDDSTAARGLASPEEEAQP